MKPPFNSSNGPKTGIEQPVSKSKPIAGTANVLQVVIVNFRFALGPVSEHGRSTVPVVVG
jgi:hypothetical protein